MTLGLERIDLFSQSCFTCFSLLFFLNFSQSRGKTFLSLFRSKFFHVPNRWSASHILRSRLSVIDRSDPTFTLS